MSDDEDDPVVEEMPVFLSHALEKQLYIFQFPTRPAGTSQDSEKIVKCCFKPQNQEVLMEVAVDTNNPNYDVSHGEQIAVNVDGAKTKTPNEKYFQSSMMDKRTLQSTKVVSDTSNLAVGIIKNKQLILTPIQGVLSITPSFPHLDVTDKRAKEEAKDMGEDVSGGEEEEGEKQVTVKFARQESDRVKKAREQSYKFLSKKSAEEKWYETKYHSSTSHLAEVERNRLVNVEQEDQRSSMCLTPQQYLDKLVPLQTDASWSLPSLPSHVTSLTSLANQPLPDIVLAILKEVKIITFRQLSGLLAGQGDAVKLLRSVQQVAVLVQGNWVVRSECLYPKESFSEHNGVPGEVMCRARDYTLFLFSEGKCLERKQVAATVRLPPEELKLLLSQVSRLRRNKGWELLLPPDTEFIERNPEVVERQQRAWATKHKQIMESLESENINISGRARQGSRRRESSMSGGSDLESPRRRRNDSCRSLSSDTESGAESSNRRRKRNSESKPEHRKRNSNSESANGKRKVKTEMASPEPVS